MAADDQPPQGPTTQEAQPPQPTAANLDLQNATYFDPSSDWPKPIELNATLPIVLEQLAFLGDTRSRRELSESIATPADNVNPPARYPCPADGQ